MNVERKVYDMEELLDVYKYEKAELSFKERLKILLLFLQPSWLSKLLPIMQWLRKYDLKTMLAGDIIGGMTVAILQLPQAMACAILADIPAVNGIYTSIFPVVVYVVFGTSRHNSVGTFAAISLMTGSIVSEHSNNDNQSLPEQYTNVEVAQAISFTVAVIQLGMFVLRLGAVSQLLSETFLDAFTSSVAYHIMNSQVRDLLGLPTEKRRGSFAIPLTVYDLVTYGNQANVVAVGISLATCSALLANNFLLKPWLSKITPIPFPAELVVVGIITTCSELMDFNANYDVTIIGQIPTGFPEMSLPKFRLMPTIFLDSLAIVIVAYAVTISLALIFARKCFYEIDSNQELLALGLSNGFGSVTQCMPISASLSRTLLRHNAGGKTQLAAVVSSSLLLIVIVWIAPLFEALPRCILASIIVVALTELLLKVRLVGKYWLLSRWEGIIWTVTFLVTFIFNISGGLIAGVCTSLLVMGLQCYTPNAAVLGVIPNTDLYLDVEKYKAAREMAGIKIFRSSGVLNFSVTQRYQNALFRKTGLNPRREYIKMVKENRDLEGDFVDLNYVILDFSNITFIDRNGAKFLATLSLDYSRVNIEMIIGGCSVTSTQFNISLVTMLNLPFD